MYKVLSTSDIPALTLQAHTYLTDDKIHSIVYIGNYSSDTSNPEGYSLCIEPHKKCVSIMRYYKGAFSLSFSFSYSFFSSFHDSLNSLSGTEPEALTQVALSLFSSFKNGNPEAIQNFIFPKGMPTSEFYKPFYPDSFNIAYNEPTLLKDSEGFDLLMPFIGLLPQS